MVSLVKCSSFAKMFSSSILIKDMTIGRTIHCYLNLAKFILYLYDLLPQLPITGVTFSCVHINKSICWFTLYINNNIHNLLII